MEPFNYLFEKTTPKEFSVIFAKEACQTRAFLLSFAPDADYAQSVIDIYNDDEFTGMVAEYLSHVEDQAVNSQFVHELSVYLEGMIGKQGDSSLKRKNMAIRRNKEITE
jgi:FPC/CPF motif-containing protein YcgG